MSPDVRNELSELTVAKLRSFASELEIKGRSKMRKAELVDALCETPGVERFVTSAPSAAETPAASAPSRPAEGTAGSPPSEPRRNASSDQAARSGGMAPEPASEPSAERSPAPAPGAAALSTDGAPRENPPPEAGSGSLGLLGVDPTCVFVFWDVDQELIARARDCVGDPQGALVLRTYGVAGSQGPGGSSVRGRFDLFVDGAKGEQYLQVADAGQCLRCELGVESRDGRFHVFAWSNRLELPVDGQTAARAVRKMRVSGDPSPHWHARGVVVSPRPESAVVPAEAALPTDEEGSRSPGSPAPDASETVLPPEDLAALFEPIELAVEYRVSLSSAETLRRARQALFSGAVGMSSSSGRPKEDLEAHAGRASNGSRSRIVLPGLVPSGPEAD